MVASCNSSTQALEKLYTLRGIRIDLITSTRLVSKTEIGNLGNESQ